MERTVFFISDHTGITAEVLGHSLLSRFEDTTFQYITRPFVNTTEKAEQVVRELEQVTTEAGERPFVFMTITDPQVLAVLYQTSALLFDLFAPYLKTLERELGKDPTQRIGRYHSIKDVTSYQTRIDAVEFALVTDDGLGTRQYERADIILVGVSRVGKTPTCLYLGLQYGIRASNYPLAEEDFSRFELPQPLREYQEKIFGLTIDPLRLHQIRNKRKADSRYAALSQCQYEVEQAERLFRTLNIPYLNTTTVSIEEISATIMQTADLKRRLK